MNENDPLHGPDKAGAPEQTEPFSAPPLDVIYDLSRQALTENNLKDFASIDLVPDSTMYIILTGDLLFDTGRADLPPTARHSLQKIIMEGVIAIDSEMNSVLLKTKLESFLTPSERIEELVSYRKIKERFNIREDTEGGPYAHD